MAGSSPEKKGSENIFARFGRQLAARWDELLSFIAFLGRAVYSCLDALRHPGKIRKRETFYYMNLCGADGLPITALITFLTGIILAYQSAVQMEKYGADGFLAGLVGCAMVRELAPLMVAIIATGRVGSAFAAEIGSMKISEEIDALRTMGILPERFLFIPKLIAMVTMMPLLAIAGDILGILGGALIGTTFLGQTAGSYYSMTITWVKPEYFVESIIKTFLFGIIITLVSCHQGFLTGKDALAVGRSTTRAVVLSILFVIIADTILAHFFNTIFFD